MKRTKAVVVEYNNGVEMSKKKYKSIEKAWMDAEYKNITDPLCIEKLRFFKVERVKSKTAIDNIAQY